ncbi:uncharacterized protein TERG_12456 [Trichophyton rubrum CBS 118892]|uniref:Uncharacterized protein n=1 Tax=Trichophyton rubrum (strain ATCC MYA-4607 / CBS 118892) TaxID=559305 RepID=A0A080WQ20_TRIRC|nr:uncharacterized protein TERG_12456 [Trichophyton rubrum CBS 118892]KFL62475.1 hypothetical protein TERG_12456 [Trichophyton rubrum CBS 118892]
MVACRTAGGREVTAPKKRQGTKRPKKKKNKKKKKKQNKTNKSPEGEKSTDITSFYLFTFYFSPFSLRSSFSFTGFPPWEILTIPCPPFERVFFHPPKIGLIVLDFCADVHTLLTDLTRQFHILPSSFVFRLHYCLVKGEW